MVFWLQFINWFEDLFLTSYIIDRVIFVSMSVNIYYRSRQMKYYTIDSMLLITRITIGWSIKLAWDYQNALGHMQKLFFEVNVLQSENTHDIHKYVIQGDKKNFWQRIKSEHDRNDRNNKKTLLRHGARGGFVIDCFIFLSCRTSL